MSPTDQAFYTPQVAKACLDHRKEDAGRQGAQARSTPRKTDTQWDKCIENPAAWQDGHGCDHTKKARLASEKPCLTIAWQCQI